MSFGNRLKNSELFLRRRRSVSLVQVNGCVIKPSGKRDVLLETLGANHAADRFDWQAGWNLWKHYQGDPIFRAEP